MPESTPRLKPMGWLASILYFGIPSLLFTASILGLLPWMIRHGYSQVTTFFVTFGAPLLAMLIAALLFYRLEGRPWTWPAFRDRMRLQKPTARDWLWTVGLVVVATLGGAVVFPAAQLFSGIHFIPHRPNSSPSWPAFGTAASAAWRCTADGTSSR